MKKYPKDFKDWYHQNAKDYKLPGQPDPDLGPIYDEWLNLGSPSNFSGPSMFLPPMTKYGTWYLNPEWMRVNVYYPLTHINWENVIRNTTRYFAPAGVPIFAL